MTVAVGKERKMAENKNNLKENLPHDYGCEVLVENGTWEQVTTKDVPNDARIVKYELDGKLCFDLTRGPKVSRIFDMYWDKYREGIKSIDFGYGRMNPKLWGEKKQEKRKRK
jgi:hypothetical protein